MKLCSAIPGRARWECTALVDQPQRCQAVELTVQSLEGVRSVSANPLTGRILINYHPRLAAGEIAGLLQRTLDDVLTHKPDFLLTRRSDQSTVGRFLDLTARHQHQVVTTFTVSFLERLFEASPPAMIGAAIDVVTRGNASFLGRLGLRTIPSQLIALGGVCLVVWSLDAFMGYLHSVTAANLGAVVQEDLRNRVYSHLQTFDIGQIEKRSVSSWMTLLNADISRIGNYIESGVDPLVTIATNAVIVTTNFLYHSPALFAVHLILLPALHWLSAVLLKPIKQGFEHTTMRSEQLSAALHGNVTGMSTIRVFGAEKAEEQRIANLGLQLKQSSAARVRLSAAYVPSIQMVVGAGFLTTLVWGGVLVNRGTLSVASFNFMGFTSLRLLAALGSLGHSLDQYQRASVSMERIIDFLDKGPAIADGSEPMPPLIRGDIEFKNVHFGYERGKPVLNGVNMRFAAGRTTGIVGSTGAGKTTILKLLLRFYDVNSGEVRLDGEDIRQFVTDDYRRSISLVPQHVFLFEGTIRDNIAYGRPSASLAEIHAAARAAQAHEFIEELPNGYDTLILEGGTSLSGGQRQRIAIARALLVDRSILLFDEATSALDYETEAAVQSALVDMIAGKTTVIVAHRLSTIRHSDHIYVLDEGRVHEEGTHSQLLRRNGIYASLWRLQTGEAAAVRTKPTRKRPRKKK